MKAGLSSSFLIFFLSFLSFSYANAVPNKVTVTGFEGDLDMCDAKQSFILTACITEANIGQDYTLGLAISLDYDEGDMNLNKTSFDLSPTLHLEVDDIKRLNVTKLDGQTYHCGAYTHFSYELPHFEYDSSGPNPNVHAAFGFLVPGQVSTLKNGEFGPNYVSDDDVVTSMGGAFLPSNNDNALKFAVDKECKV